MFKIPPRQQQSQAHQVAGHGGIKSLQGGRILQKPTNAREYRLYALMRGGEALQGLAAVSPTSYSEHDPQLGLAGEEAKGVHVFLENMTHGMKSPKILDIKIGFRAASKNELLTHEGATPAAARWKKARLTAADVFSTSASLGFGVVGGTGVSGTRISRGRDSIQHLREYSSDSQVYGAIRKGLERIREAVREEWMAPLGASVLIAFDEASDNRASSVKVKLIDLAHTFGVEEGLTQEQVTKYQDRFILGISSLISTIAEISSEKHL
ncbi:inositol polyphosphate kinase family protein [Streptomyces olivoreticuli]